MNVALSWLKEYVDIDCNINDLVSAITMSGSNVETVKHLNSELKSIVVGKITSVQKHISAKKLYITKVNIGLDNELSIVTGADNIKVGDYVPVAIPGAVLADGIKIDKAILVGEHSEGMLCSIQELGYTDVEYPEAAKDGIYIFNKEVKPGDDVIQILELKEDVIEFEITSNRPDCLSMLGMAREVSATLGCALREPALVEPINNKLDKISITIDNEACSTYIAVVLDSIKVEPSPQWLRHRLIVSGIKPINGIVDITNYVMLELGQPMHAFDFECIEDRTIKIRSAINNEEIVTLDGVKRELDTDILVIADTKKALAVAGIIGGENSKVTQSTKTIVLEAAKFNSSSIRLSSKKLRIRTESSARFSKGIYDDLPKIAIIRAINLIERLGYGRLISSIVTKGCNKSDAVTVAYSRDNINKLLGINLSEEDIKGYLNALSIKTQDGLAYIPSHRTDITIEVDLAEEVARLYGYDNIETGPLISNTAGQKTMKQKNIDKIKNVLVGCGALESMHYSFESPDSYDKLLFTQDSKARSSLKIINPLGVDFSVMRTSTANGMLISLANNYKKRNVEAILFEIGNIYNLKDYNIGELPYEIPILTVGSYGAEYDFFYLKGIADLVCKELGAYNISFDKNTDISYLHPGITANIYIDSVCIGFVGQVHPVVLDNYEIGTKSYFMFINIDNLLKHIKGKAYRPIPKYPSAQRDLALNVPNDVLCRDIEMQIKLGAGELLDSIRLFDIYSGPQVEKGFKSLAYSVFLRSDKKTLNDEEVDSKVEEILASLKNIGVELRKN
jgi:phenylalanyl-tRNA synthetase beta chain